MTTRRRALWTFGVAAAVVAALAGRMTADTVMAGPLAVEFVQQQDSTHITIHTYFRPPVDAHGDTVPVVRWRVFTGRSPNRQEILVGAARLDTTVRENGRVVLRWRVPKPPPGDTTTYSYSLRSVDRLGVPSREVFSQYLVLAGCDLYPFTYDSLTVHLVEGGPAVGDSVPIRFTYVGETLKLCYLAWYGLHAEAPTFDLVWRTTGSDSDAVRLEPVGRSCVNATSVRATEVLGMVRDRASYQRALP